MMCLVTVGAGSHHWVRVSASWAWGLGRPLRLVELVSRDLVGRSASQTCSTKTWVGNEVTGLFRVPCPWVPDINPQAFTLFLGVAGFSLRLCMFWCVQAHLLDVSPEPRAICVDCLGFTLASRRNLVTSHFHDGHHTLSVSPLNARVWRNLGDSLMLVTICR
jgi:hypothetical protein